MNYRPWMSVWGSALLAGSLIMIGCRSDGSDDAATSTTDPGTNASASGDSMANELQASHETASTTVPGSDAASAATPEPEAPDFTLAVAGGGTFTLSSQKSKHPVLVNFFATY